MIFHAMSEKWEKWVADTGFIPGIYNFCDQWCEHCTFHAHCMNFVLGERIKEEIRFNRPDELHDDDEEVFALIDDTFDETLDLLEELAKERGVSVDTIYQTERMEREYWGDDFEDTDHEENEVTSLVEQNDMSRTFLIYEWLTDQTQNRIYPLLEKMEEQGEEMSRIHAIDNALIEVGWYLDLLYAKLKRALYGHYLSANELIGDESDDINGSAKLCLISLEKARKHWAFLKTALPTLKGDIAQLEVVIGQMERDLHAFFPKAPLFRRPGFD